MSEDNSEMQFAVMTLISEITGVDLGELRLDSSVENLDSWDSVSHINIILSLEKQFGVTIDPGDAIELTSVQSLVKFLDRHGQE